MPISMHIVTFVLNNSFQLVPNIYEANQLPRPSLSHFSCGGYHESNFNQLEIILALDCMIST